MGRKNQAGGDKPGGFFEGNLGLRKTGQFGRFGRASLYRCRKAAFLDPLLLSGLQFRRLARRRRFRFQAEERSQLPPMLFPALLFLASDRSFAACFALASAGCSKALKAVLFKRASTAFQFPLATFPACD